MYQGGISFIDSVIAMLNKLLKVIHAWVSWIDTPSIHQMNQSTCPNLRKLTSKNNQKNIEWPQNQSDSPRFLFHIELPLFSVLI